jgi:chromosome segregation ATPase
MYRGLLWVAWAVEECSRAFTRISARLGDAERRLGSLEAQKATPSSAVFDVEAADANHAPASDADEKIDRLEARIEEAVGNERRRVDALEERLRQLDFLPLKVSNLHRSVDQLASSQRRATDAERPPPETPDDEIAELRRELAMTHRRLEQLDARMSEASMAATVAEAVRSHAEGFAAQIPAGAVDVEGVYRELDAVAEFVAARAASTAEGLERIGPLEVAVLELRRDLGRALADLAAGHGVRDADLRLQDVESRLRALECSGRKVERLYSVLEGLVQIRESDEPGPSRGDGPPLMSVNGTALLAQTPGRDGLH